MYGRKGCEGVRLTQQLWIADMGGAKGFSDDIFTLFFYFYLCFSGLSLTCTLLPRVCELFLTLFLRPIGLLRWIDGGMHFLGSLVLWSVHSIHYQSLFLRWKRRRKSHAISSSSAPKCIDANQTPTNIPTDTKILLPIITSFL